MDRLAFLGLTLATGLAGAPPALAEAPARGDDLQAPIHDPADLHPAAPLPPDAILPGDPAVTGIVCEADPPPFDASGALGPADAQPVSGFLRRSVRVENPWTAAPVMTGAGASIEVVLFKRGRTLIFDAGSEVLYLDRDRHRFTYTQSAIGRVTTWHGTCHPEG